MRVGEWRLCWLITACHGLFVGKLSISIFFLCCTVIGSFWLIVSEQCRPCDRGATGGVEDCGYAAE